jgi:hypothetical protein
MGLSQRALKARLNNARTAGTTRGTIPKRKIDSRFQRFS